MRLRKIPGRGAAVDVGRGARHLPDAMPKWRNYARFTEKLSASEGYLLGRWSPCSDQKPGDQDRRWESVEHDRKHQ